MIESPIFSQFVHEILSSLAIYNFSLRVRCYICVKKFFGNYLLRGRFLSLTGWMDRWEVRMIGCREGGNMDGA